MDIGIRLGRRFCRRGMRGVRRRRERRRGRFIRWRGWSFRERLSNEWIVEGEMLYKTTVQASKRD